MLENGNQVL
jgi:hypothetical protein